MAPRLLPRPRIPGTLGYLCLVVFWFRESHVLHHSEINIETYNNNGNSMGIPVVICLTLLYRINYLLRFLYLLVVLVFLETVVAKASWWYFGNVPKTICFCCLLTSLVINNTDYLKVFSCIMESFVFLSAVGPGEKVAITNKNKQIKTNRCFKICSILHYR